MDRLKELRSQLREMFLRSKSGEDFNAASQSMLRKINKGIIYSGLTESEFYSAKKRVVLESNEPRTVRIKLKGGTRDGKAN
jgi:hypothetical protein